MPYVKKTWANDEIIEVEELNHIEQGIADMHAIVDVLQEAVDKTVLDRMHVYEAISIAANTADSSIIDVDTTDSNIVSIQAINSGTSTDVEIKIYCANDGFAYSSTAIDTLNLNQVLKNDICFVEALYDKIKLVITNKDLTHATTVDVAIKILTNTGSMVTSRYDSDADGTVDSADIAAKLDDGVNGKAYSDIANKISADIATHAALVNAHHTRYTDAEAQAAINADIDHGTTAQHNYRTDEEIRDVVAAFITQGDDILVVHNDVANTLTISSNGLSAADRTKFDGIEVGATADQTAAEIVALINASALKIDADNVNITGTGLSPADRTKLDGIETGATADQTAAEIVALINASALKIDADNVNLAIGTLTAVIERGFTGEVVPGDTLRIYIPRAGTITSARIISAVQPSVETCLVDIRKNGVATTNSIFTSDTPMVLATNAAAVNGVYTVNGTLDAAQTTLAAGDVLRAIVTQAGNVADLSVCLEVLF